MKFIPYGKQCLDEDDIQSVVDVLKSDWLTTGPKIKEFEEKFAEYTGSKFASAVNSGTAALHAAFFAAGLKPGDEFITTPITFASTANAGLFLGGKPVFADINPETRNIDSEKIEESITEKTKIIVPVDFTGKPAEMEKIRIIADKYNLKIIEDACHALGGEYKNVFENNCCGNEIYSKNIENANSSNIRSSKCDKSLRIGSCKYSDFTVFSFHPVKHITTGEGGMVTVNNEEDYEKINLFRTHGITRNREFMNNDDGAWYYEMHELGFNYRITDFQTALGISQLKKIDYFIEKRRKLAIMYNDLLSGLPLRLPVINTPDRDAWHLYVIEVKNSKRKELFDYLRENKIGVNVHYIPVYKHPYYKKIMGKEIYLENAEKYYSNCITLPLHPQMTEEEILYIVNKIKDFYK